MSSLHQPTTAAGTDRRRWIALLVVCFAQLMIVLDTTIVNVALPYIQHDLNFSQGSLTWVINAFLVSFGSLLLFAGRLGDLIGRKRVFLTGLTVFTLASLACGLAPSAGVLIGARFVQGVGAALQASVILAIIVTEFPEPGERAKAMSGFVFTSVAGGSLGLLAGGLLTQLLNWHWIFIVNLPIGVGTFVFGRMLIPNDRGLGLDRGIDWLGSVLVTGTVAAAVYGIIEATTDGWGSINMVAPLVAAVVLLGVFLAFESRHPNPIMPLRIFGLRALMLTSVVRGFMISGMYGIWFLGTLYMEKILGYGALNTGLAFLPWTLTIAVFSLGLNRRVLARFGQVNTLVGGMTLAVISMLVLREGGPHSGYFPIVFFAMFGMGLGLANSFMPLMTMAMADVPAHDAGLASGIVQVSQQVSGALGLAVLATVSTSHTHSLLASGQSNQSALLAGYHLAFLVGAAAIALGIVVAVTLLRRTQTTNPLTPTDVEAEIASAETEMIPA